MSSFDSFLTWCFCS